MTTSTEIRSIIINSMRCADDSVNSSRRTDWTSAAYVIFSLSECVRDLMSSASAIVWKYAVYGV